MKRKTIDFLKTILLSGIFICNVLYIYADNPPEDVITGLTAHWKLDESSDTIIDDLGISNGVIYGEGVKRIDGVIGKAIDFAASSDTARIEIPHTDNITFDSTESFTVSMLVKCDFINSTGEMMMLTKGAQQPSCFPGSTGKWYAITFKNEPGYTSQIRFTVDDNRSKTQLNYLLPLEYDIYSWRHIVGVRNRNDSTIMLYLDGEEVASDDDLTDNSIAVALPIYIGSYYNPDHIRKYYGSIDDIRIYNIALPADSIQALYEMYDIKSEDATLSSLSVDGYKFSKDTFSSTEFNYSVYLPESVNEVNVNAVASHVNATIAGDGIFTDIPGTDTISVTAEDGVTVNKYTINFEYGTSIMDNGFTNSISVYPNPNNGIFIIYIEYIQPENVELRIFNSLGQQVLIEQIKQAKGTYTGQFDLREYPAGIYYLQIEGINGVINKQIIIE